LRPRKLNRSLSQSRKPKRFVVMMKKRNSFRKRRRRPNPRKPKM
jgi:hypothetical protein